MLRSLFAPALVPRQPRSPIGVHSGSCSSNPCPSCEVRSAINHWHTTPEPIGSSTCLSKQHLHLFSVYCHNVSIYPRTQTHDTHSRLLLRFPPLHSCRRVANRCPLNILGIFLNPGFRRHPHVLSSMLLGTPIPIPSPSLKPLPGLLVRSFIINLHLHVRRALKQDLYARLFRWRREYSLFHKALPVDPYHLRPSQDRSYP